MEDITFVMNGKEYKYLQSCAPATVVDCDGDRVISGHPDVIMTMISIINSVEQVEKEILRQRDVSRRANERASKASCNERKYWMQTCLGIEKQLEFAKKTLGEIEVDCVTIGDARTTAGCAISVIDGVEFDG